MLSFSGPRGFGVWLAQNHATSRGIWLKLAKKASSTRSVTYPEALEVALAWGWIDGQKQRHDDDFWLQRFTPRVARSPWSKINREKALALIASGKMQPPGLEQVERARKDGRWERAYDSSSRAVVPEDLAAELAKNTRAARFFETLEARNRYAILYRLQQAKTEKGRKDRLAKFVAMLANHEKLHP